MSHKSKVHELFGLSQMKCNALVKESESRFFSKTEFELHTL